MKKTVVVALLLLIAVGAFSLGWAVREASTPPPPLPPLPEKEIVYVDVVKEIEVEVPGPERVVERVVWKTETVEVPVEVVREVERIVTTNNPNPIVGDIEIEALKYEGRHPETGKLVQGWDGTARCHIAEVLGGERQPWIQLVSKGFDLEASVAESVVPPGIHLVQPKLRRWGWWSSISADFDKESFETFDTDQGPGRYFSRQTAESVRVGAGLSFRTKRTEWRAGLTTAPGVQVGVSRYRRAQ